MLPTPTPILTTSNNPAPLCPSDEWYYFNETNSCYYWTDSSDWATAEAFCVSQNAHLTSIHSSAEMDFFKFIYNGNIWVGLHADKGPIELNTEWQWTDGSYLDYLPWKGDYNFPYTNSYFQCVQAEQYYIWNINCSSMATGVCKKPSSKIVATTGSPPILKCPAGWTYYKKTNSCYLGPTQNFTQNAAETYCTSVGGHLPSIHDINELKFLVYVTSSTFWIGLYSKDNPVQLNTTWKWTDNTPGMMNLTTAEEYCQLCGGHLTSIHSFGELYTIVDKLYQKGPSNTTSPNYWTGLYSTNEGRTWKWNDGSPYDFSYWMSEYPYKGGPSCANLIINWGDYYNPSSYGMANNMNCSTSLYGICKYHF
uniref:C-type lectin domain-containing protein n=1 Tax=Panagrolaimus sp. PS1159 TaxID=55785 RepID=A0AC35F6V0_9BILA